MPSQKKATALPVIKRRRLVFRNSRWIVYADHIADRNGIGVADYLSLTHRYRRGASRWVTGVAVLPVLSGKLGLVRIYRHAHRAFFWEVPRGFIDRGEKPRHAALRELEEETGLICVRRNLAAAGFVAQEPSTLDSRTALFIARNCKFGGRRVGELGLGQVKFFTLDDVAHMVARSAIEDACTLAVCLHYFALAKK
jgi:ADP-ribose pyrophosphatase